MAMYIQLQYTFLLHIRKDTYIHTYIHTNIQAILYTYTAYNIRIIKVVLVLQVAVGPGEVHGVSKLADHFRRIAERGGKLEEVDKMTTTTGTHIHTYIHTRTQNIRVHHTYIHGSLIKVYINSYIHTYIHTYIHVPRYLCISQT